MQKKIIVLMLSLSSMAIAAPKKYPLLTHPLLKQADGTFITKTHIENMFWLRQEIKRVHDGGMKINDQGEADPLRSGVPCDIIFKGQKRTLLSLIELESHYASFTPEELAEFDALFHLVKDYAGKVNAVLLDDARGAHEVMTIFIKEFCLKHHRPDSALLTWQKGTEIEHYRRRVTSFKKLSVFSLDLYDFIACLIKSCPIASQAYIDSKSSLRKKAQRR